MRKGSVKKAVRKHVVSKKKESIPESARAEKKDENACAPVIVSSESAQVNVSVVENDDAGSIPDVSVKEMTSEIYSSNSSLQLSLAKYVLKICYRIANQSILSIKKRGILFNKLLITGLAAVVIVGLFTSSVYFYFLTKKEQTMLAKFREPQTEKADSILSQVQKLFLFPDKGPVTVATITDISKLQTQPFFRRAQNGDKVLFFTDSKMAVLYRPSASKIIDISPINFTSPQTEVMGSSTKSASLKSATVAIYNGTKKKGFTKSAQKLLEEKMKDIEVVLRSDAKSDYKETIVVDLSGNLAGIASNAAQTIGGKLQTFLPAGETKPKADLLIILGSNVPL